MNKAATLGFFAGLTLIASGISGAFYIIRGSNAVYGSTSMVLIGLGLIFAGLLQYAILGGAAEIIKRLVSIDEKIKSSQTVLSKQQLEGDLLTPAERVQVLFGRDLR